MPPKHILSGAAVNRQQFAPCINYLLHQLHGLLLSLQNPYFAEQWDFKILTESLYQPDHYVLLL